MRAGIDPRAFGGAIPWDYAFLFVSEVLRDPANHLAAAMQGMEYPFSRGDIELLHLRNITAAINTKNYKPDAGPFKKTAKARGNSLGGSSLPQKEVRALLKSHAVE